jgi:hypothetical protein
MLYILRQYEALSSENPLLFDQLILNNTLVQTHFSSLSVFITLILCCSMFSLNLTCGPWVITVRYGTWRFIIVTTKAHYFCMFWVSFPILISPLPSHYRRTIHKISFYSRKINFDFTYHFCKLSFSFSILSPRCAFVMFFHSMLLFAPTFSPYFVSLTIGLLRWTNLEDLSCGKYFLSQLTRLLRAHFSLTSCRAAHQVPVSPSPNP